MRRFMGSKDAREMARLARRASRHLAATPAEVRNQALCAIRSALMENKEMIFESNREDVRTSEREGLSVQLIKRLHFDEKKLKDVCAGLEDLSRMKDPLGRTTLHTELAEGLILRSDGFVTDFYRKD